MNMLVNPSIILSCGIFAPQLLQPIPTGFTLRRLRSAVFHSRDGHCHENLTRVAVNVQFRLTTPQVANPSW